MQGKGYVRLSAAVLFVLCAILPAGCGGMKADTDVTNLVINKSGQITHTIVEDFAKDFYTVEELEAMIREETADYNASAAGGEITLESAELSGTEADTIVVTMQYSGSDVYADFNGVAMFFGTVAAARAAGYDLNVTLADSADASMTVSADSIEETQHILITGQNIRISLPYKVLYLSEGASLVDSRTVSGQPGSGEETDSQRADSLIYVITK